MTRGEEIYIHSSDSIRLVCVEPLNSFISALSYKTALAISLKIGRHGLLHEYVGHMHARRMRNVRTDNDSSAVDPRKSNGSGRLAGRCPSCNKSLTRTPGTNHPTTTIASNNDE